MVGWNHADGDGRRRAALYGVSSTESTQLAELDVIPCSLKFVGIVFDHHARNSSLEESREMVCRYVGFLGQMFDPGISDTARRHHSPQGRTSSLSKKQPHDISASIHFTSGPAWMYRGQPEKG